MADTNLGIDGSGYGYGYGYGYGSGYGYGYGYGSFVKIVIPESSAWEAYHYIPKNEDNQFVMRNGQIVNIGEHIHENNIKMCACGLHASLLKEDANKYAPKPSILTKVKIWGDIMISRDKIVATDRMIIKVIV
jgi:hypothetical protein